VTNTDHAVPRNVFFSIPLSPRLS